jgi:cytochrome c biogenesis factor
MSSLGYYLLLAAFVVCAYATAISVAGARRRSRPMIESGIGAFYLLAAIMTAANLFSQHKTGPVSRGYHR